MIQRMREARKNAPKDPNSKDEFVSEEVEKIRRKNELEIQEFEEDINKIKSTKQNITEENRRFETISNEVKEKLKDLDEEILIKKKDWKKKTDLLKDLNFYQGKDMSALDTEIAELESQFRELQKQWDEYQKPIKEEISDNKNKLQDMKLEYGYKQTQIQEIKKSIKKSLQELKYKKV